MNKKIIFAAAIIIATAAYWLSIPQWERIKKEPSIQCGFTNCHGFDVQCGLPALRALFCCERHVPDRPLTAHVQPVQL